MKLGKEAKKFALDLTQETMDSMKMFPEIQEWSGVLMEAYNKLLELGDTCAMALMITMLHQTLDYEEYTYIKQVFENCDEHVFIDNSLTYITSNKMDEVLK